MPPPTVFVMSTGAAGPRGDRRPTGVVHAALSTHPPTNTTLCGQANGLYWFGGLPFSSVERGRCPTCVRLLPEVVSRRPDDAPIGGGTPGPPSCSR